LRAACSAPIASDRQRNAIDTPATLYQVWVAARAVDKAINQVLQVFSLRDALDHRTPRPKRSDQQVKVCVRKPYAVLHGSMVPLERAA